MTTTQTEATALPIPWPEGIKTTTHEGGCHCKAIRYKFEYPEMYSLPALSCNCSICQDRGCINVYTLESMFTFTKGSADDLTTYEFGGNSIKHRFCRVCGSNIGPAVPSRGFVVVNVRTVDEIDLEKLQVVKADLKNKRFDENGRIVPE